jgi:hypothetical protein
MKEKSVEATIKGITTIEHDCSLFILPTLLCHSGIVFIQYDPLICIFFRRCELDSTKYTSIIYVRKYQNISVFMSCLNFRILAA